MRGGGGTRPAYNILHFLLLQLLHAWTHLTPTDPVPPPPHPTPPSLPYPSYHHVLNRIRRYKQFYTKADA
jgi:hypothetical protein